MKINKTTILLSLMLISALGASTLQATQDEKEIASTSTKWEYKITNLLFQIPNKKMLSIEDRMNHLGLLGWELVTVISKEGVPSDQYIFKRIKE